MDMMDFCMTDLILSTWYIAIISDIAKNILIEM